MRPQGHQFTCAKQLRQRCLDAGCSLAEGSIHLTALVAEIVACCEVLPLKAHRLARGWKVQQAVDALHALCRREALQCGMTREQLSHFENGMRPGRDYRDLLCRLYETGPVQMGWAKDYSRPGAQPQPLPATRSRHGQTRARRVSIEANSDDGEEAVKRRDMLRTVLAAGGTLPLPVLDELDHMRGRMDAHLGSSSISAATLDRWEEAVHGYGFGFKSRPPRALLEDVLLDFAELQQHAAHRQPIEHQMRLCRLSAQLAGMAGNILADLGHHRHARRWFSTAQIAADETNDRACKAWVRAREATVSLYHHQPAQTALALAGEAQQWSGQIPCAGAALAASTEARAYARLGDTTRALESLRRAQAIADKLSGTHLENSIYGYPRQQMAFHTEATLTAIGRLKEAGEAQRAALALYPASEYVNPTLIRLDQAACLIRSGDLHGGYQLAAEYLTAMPDGYRTPLVLSRAHELVDVSHAGQRGSTAFNNYRETLHSLTPA